MNPVTQQEAGVGPGTALPWRLSDLGEISGFTDLIALTVSSGNIGQQWKIERERGPYPNVPQARANAAYIVLACNSFPKLVEALEDLIARCDANQRSGGGSMVPPSARAALRLARGGQ